MALRMQLGANALSLPQWGRFYLSNSNASLQLGAGAILLSLHFYVVFKAYQIIKVPTDAPKSRHVSPDITSNDVKKQDIRVSKLLIHPIKSCRGISVREVNFTPEGLENDRVWCIADAETNVVLTAREYPRMVLINPSLKPDTTNPHGGVLSITFPEGSNCEAVIVPLRPSRKILEKWKIVDDAKLWSDKDINCYVCEALSPTEPSPSAVLSKYMGKAVNLLFKGPRTRYCEPTSLFPELDASLWFQDGYPLLVLSEESTAMIEKEARKHIGQQGVHERWKQEKISIERFRPNIVVSGAGPFAEDTWKVISIRPSTQLSEETSFSIVSLCARCLMPNIDIGTGERDPAVPYKVLMKFRSGLKKEERFKPCAGCNAVPHGSGVLRVGDYVTVRQSVTKG